MRRKESEPPRDVEGTSLDAHLDVKGAQLVIIHDRWSGMSPVSPGESLRTQPSHSGS